MFPDTTSAPGVAEAESTSEKAEPMPEFCALNQYAAKAAEGENDEDGEYRPSSA